MNRLEYKIYKKRWRRTFDGYFRVMWHQVNYRCNGSKGIKAFYKGLKIMTKTEWNLLLKLTEPKRKVLYDLWVSSNYSRKLSPSIDRINPDKGYLFDNCQFITLSDNCARSRGTFKPGYISRTVYKTGHPAWNKNP